MERRGTEHVVVGGGGGVRGVGNLTFGSTLNPKP